MKTRRVMAFLMGVVIGTAFSTLVDEEGKKKIKKMLNRQIARFRKEYEGPIRERISEIIQFLKTHLAK